MSMTLSKYMHDCWITSLNHEHLLSTIVGICQSKEDQQHPASSLSPQSWPCHGACLAASAQPLAPNLVSSAHPPALALLPTPCCWGPQTWATKQALEILQRLSLYRHKMLSSHPPPSRTSRGGTLLCSIQKFQGQNSWTLAACVKTKLHMCIKHQCSFIWACWVRCAIMSTPRALWWPVAVGSGTCTCTDTEHRWHLRCQ